MVRPSPVTTASYIHRTRNGCPSPIHLFQDDKLARCQDRERRNSRSSFKDLELAARTRFLRLKSLASPDDLSLSAGVRAVPSDSLCAEFEKVFQNSQEVEKLLLCLEILQQVDDLVVSKSLNFIVFAFSKMLGYFLHGGQQMILHWMALGRRSTKLNRYTRWLQREDDMVRRQGEFGHILRLCLKISVWIFG